MRWNPLKSGIPQVTLASGPVHSTPVSSKSSFRLGTQLSTCHVVHRDKLENLFEILSPHFRRASY